MPRTARIAPGGMVFHVLNRANARAQDFRQGSRLRGLRASDERDAGKNADADSGLPDHAHPLAPRALAGARRRIGRVHAAAYHHARSALASASQDGRLRPSLPRNLQVISDRDGRALADGSLLRRAKRPARGTRPARRRLALVEPVALAARGLDRGRAAVDAVACRAAAAMAAPGKPSAAQGGGGSDANVDRARSPFRQRDLADYDRPKTRARIHLSTSRKTKEKK